MQIQTPATASTTGTVTVKTENGIQQIPPMANGASRTTTQPTLNKPQPLPLTTTTITTNTANSHQLHKPPALPEKKDL